ncbi:MAG: sulfite oxidase-like oxidoreductase [Candidatus Pristimantibacillus lignocellulolyticus]|uniref:Sulfite oxidase-like oxidoreductase n=1 Tax=Candidatus Pristimantibacillus lignocellulolyticus TaxID=2994561 RepID=A0A9J6ZA99_9BACL|nr:MAG: sulfite oxidase-like oxidoreductase [Candidatus Pristimantibacillus lignocellulolyticus]
MHKKAERLKKVKAPLAAKVPPELQHRVPPGQTVTDRFPILHEGEVPHYDMSTWSIKTFGEVNSIRSFSFDELMKLPQTEITCDIHCVTRWSKLDTTWVGVKFTDFLELLGVKSEAKYVMIHGENDYTANVPLEDLMRDNILLAHTFDGEPLTEKHGGPLRMVIPHLYFWKSVKWITGFEFMVEDHPGFWEQNGFHNYAEPFAEQRFSGDGFDLPEDEWHGKEFD